MDSHYGVSAVLANHKSTKSALIPLGLAAAASAAANSEIHKKSSGFKSSNIDNFK